VSFYAGQFLSDQRIMHNMQIRHTSFLARLNKKQNLKIYSFCLQPRPGDGNEICWFPMATGRGSNINFTLVSFIDKNFFLERINKTIAYCHQCQIVSFLKMSVFKGSIGSSVDYDFANCIDTYVCLFCRPFDQVINHNYRSCADTI